MQWQQVEMNRLYKDKDWLYQRYWVDGLSLGKISQKFKISIPTLVIWMKRFEIRRRTYSEVRKGNYHSKETIRKMRDGRQKGKNHWAFGKRIICGKIKKTDWTEVRKLVLLGSPASRISQAVGLSHPTIMKYVGIKFPSLVLILKENNKIAQGASGRSRKGKPSKLKGKTYEEIFHSKEKAEKRKRHTSEWMKTDKNIKRFCTHPSYPQKVLFDLVNQMLPGAELERPVKILANKTIWLDVAVPLLKLDFEFDGEYWHKDKDKDNIRDNILKGIGWEVIRIDKAKLEAMFVINNIGRLICPNCG